MCRKKQHNRSKPTAVIVSTKHTQACVASVYERVGPARVYHRQSCAKLGNEFGCRCWSILPHCFGCYKIILPSHLNGKHQAHLIEAARPLHAFYSIVFFLRDDGRET